jgi:hypothetical protein
MRSFEIALALEKILKRLDVIDAKVSGMPQIQVQVSSRFTPTLTALSNLGGGTATQVSQVTGKSRACESKILNELSAMGVVSRSPSIEKAPLQPYPITC